MIRGDVNRHKKINDAISQEIANVKTEAVEYETKLKVNQDNKTRAKCDIFTLLLERGKENQISDYKDTTT